MLENLRVIPETTNRKRWWLKNRAGYNEKRRLSAQLKSAKNCELEEKLLQLQQANIVAGIPQAPAPKRARNTIEVSTTIATITSAAVNPKMIGRRRVSDHHQRPLRTISPAHSLSQIPMMSQSPQSSQSTSTSSLSPVNTMLFHHHQQHPMSLDWKVTRQQPPSGPLFHTIYLPLLYSLAAAPPNHPLEAFIRMPNTAPPNMYNASQ